MLIEYVPREQLDSLADKALGLANALSLVMFCLVVSVCCNCWQYLSEPSYSDADRASLTALVASLTNH